MIEAGAATREHVFADQCPPAQANAPQGWRGPCPPGRELPPSTAKRRVGGTTCLFAPRLSVSGSAGFDLSFLSLKHNQSCFQCSKKKK